MKKVAMPPKLDQFQDADVTMHERSDSHMTLKMQDWHSRRFEKVIFDIHKRTLVYRSMPAQLEAKAPIPYGIPEIAKRKIKRGKYKSGRCSSS
ncbi:MAG TPA: hypothetical protein DCW90_08715 [Lachnospiraceae bacterium]|nr:hypothetical protein [Lachnospiraceae bacterium]